MATLDTETLDALNALLEDTRASVEIELALTNGATELREREALDAMGSEEVLACCALRERLTLAGAPVTWRINGIVFHILGTERYDERLHAFARHQVAICERAESLLATVSDREAHQLLRELYDYHVQSARWAEQRANEFAATRMFDFSLPKSLRLAAHTQLAQEPAVGGANDATAPEHETAASANGVGQGTDGAIDLTAAPMEQAQAEPDQHDGSRASEGSDGETNGEARDKAPPDE